MVIVDRRLWQVVTALIIVIEQARPPCHALDVLRQPVDLVLRNLPTTYALHQSIEPGLTETQAQIDRLPEYIKRVAWGSCLLNYDYEGRYYLPKPSIHDYRPGDEDFEGHEPCTPAEAKAILKRYGLSSLMGVEVK